MKICPICEHTIDSGVCSNWKCNYKGSGVIDFKVSSLRWDEDQTYSLDENNE